VRAALKLSTVMEGPHRFESSCIFHFWISHLLPDFRSLTCSKTCCTTPGCTLEANSHEGRQPCGPKKFQLIRPYAMGSIDCMGGRSHGREPYYAPRRGSFIKPHRRSFAVGLQLPMPFHAERILRCRSSQRACRAQSRTSRALASACEYRALRHGARKPRGSPQ
jgi:hypothetical protein